MVGKTLIGGTEVSQSRLAIRSFDEPVSGAFPPASEQDFAVPAGGG